MKNKICAICAVVLTLANAAESPLDVCKECDAKLHRSFDFDAYAFHAAQNIHLTRREG